MESKYLEGKARVPLSSLKSEDLDVDSSSFPINIIEHLRDPGHAISVRITPRTRDDILRDLSYSPEQLYATLELESSPLINDHQVFYAAKDFDLDRAKAALGRDHICNVRLYCIPVQPRKICDGAVFQNVRYYMAGSWKKNRVSVAQAWMDKLSGSKRKILGSLLKHPDIIAAMDSMLCFPGYWDGLQLGNWAKHLAARINPLIINYWVHIKNVALKIMAGHEDKLHLFDANTVAILQYRAPSWNSQDRAQICDLFEDGTLFPGILSKSARDRIKDNILELPDSIPSIQTFHENMRYLTIGAKILEKHIENRPSESRADTIEPMCSSLIENLKKDWNSRGASMEVGHGRMIQVNEPTADAAVIQAFLAALRYFPYLSPEAPLRDFDKRVWMAGNFDNSVLSRLCVTLKDLGFSNANIEKGRLHPIENRHISYTQPKRRRDWRSGKPCLAGYHILLQSSFFPQLFAEPLDDKVPPELRVQSDILQAFFGGKPKVPSLASAASLRAEMDVDTTEPNEAWRSEAEINEDTRLGEVLKLWPRGNNETRPKKKGKDKMPRGIARSATSRDKPRVRGKGPKFTFRQQNVPDIPATRASDLYVGPPVDPAGIPTQALAHLTPPTKNPNRAKEKKRKHDEVYEAAEVPEKRNRRKDQVGGIQAVGEQAGAEQVTQIQPAEEPGRAVVDDLASTSQDVRWEMKAPLEAPVATPALPPSMNSQNSTPVVQRGPEPLSKPAQHVHPENNPQIPEINYDEAFSPPHLEQEAELFAIGD
ncbi:uncharacterized protein G6M90_00g027790 [Metarhizium brunneum]|uniref:Uncharacterized protein n=1 Tax=Metarhizium brunneum TaxID=500148 RepID=A0A7D5YYD1_9HYPO|nr:hypothetical protein G6M90_00g027790 [Metarhizium brunneum]